ncbi:MAG: hypothetical protein ABI895_21530 [Deltaproteobacteria bacterium]
MSHPREGDGTRSPNKRRLSTPHPGAVSHSPWGEPGLQLDRTHIAGMFFHLPAGDFDFCVSHFHFLDVNGNPVR